MRVCARLPDVESLSDFKARVQTFFDDLASTLANAGRGIERGRAFRSALVDAGLAGLGYPKEVGGQGLGPEYKAAFNEVAIDLMPGEAAIFGIGIGMCMPTLVEYGTPELAAELVPPGLRGDHIWCQLYSEPGAGSDLAGLTTKAERDGDEWIVTGQKVWTSGAQHAEMAILIARTDFDAPKHSGITMFAVPMDQPQITVRPLVQMTGAAEFNEVFLDEARIPAHYVVGEVNGGWSLAVALLAHERTSLGRGVKTDDAAKSKSGRSPLPFDGLLTRARDNDRIEDPVMRDMLTQVYIGERLVKMVAARRLHPSIGKLWRTIQGRAAAQCAHELGGMGATAWEADDRDADYWAYHVLNCRGMSLGGGTDEIQKNTLGERVLGLPREPGPARDTPFRDLARN